MEDYYVRLEKLSASLKAMCDSPDTPIEDLNALIHDRSVCCEEMIADSNRIKKKPEELCDRVNKDLALVDKPRGAGAKL
ncbi:hypothetical protein VTN77DRAFT_8478 [Rasamsonia byssochlamydoides]|uniref:uncharacterized protein n=1 Tax=Rasamsonia byssochlamydoides TaxID=89139 RepID=UPI003743D3CE